MPDLRLTLEAGGYVDVHLWRSDDRRLRLGFRVPARAEVTVESSPQTDGAYVTPQVNLDIEQYPWEERLEGRPACQTVICDRASHLIASDI
jgi:hypothetical protein